MRIDILSNKRRILSLYDGSKYIIYSQFYGVVAESTRIDRKEIDDGKYYQKVEIDFDICEWHGYWDLKTIITKGIKKLEDTFIKNDVTINYNTIYGQQEGLDKYIKAELLNR